MEMAQYPTRKLLLIFCIASWTFLVPSNVLASLESLRQGKEKELAQYADLLMNKDKIEGRLQNSQTFFADQNCSEFLQDNDCKNLKQNIILFNKELRTINEKIAVLIKKIGNYVSLADKTAEDLALMLGKNPPINELENIAGCFSSMNVWNERISLLYAQSMRTLRGNNKLKFLNQLKKIPGFSNNDCNSSADVNCWKEIYGQYYYVTKAHIQINEGCILKPRGDGNKFFFNNPRDYLKASDDVLKTIESKGCFTKMNSENAVKLAHYLSTEHPRIQCTPEKPEEGKGPDRCAFTQKNTNDIFLTAPSACGSLSGTMFHELLHAQGSIDNLETKDHNNVTCRKYDAIYHCTEFCFHEIPRPKYLHQRGCEACVALENQDQYCSKLPDEIGGEIQSCGWGGQ